MGFEECEQGDSHGDHHPTQVFGGCIPLPSHEHSHGHDWQHLARFGQHLRWIRDVSQSHHATCRSNTVGECRWHEGPDRCVRRLFKRASFLPLHRIAVVSTSMYVSRHASAATHRVVQDRGSECGSHGLQEVEHDDVWQFLPHRTVFCNGQVLLHDPLCEVGHVDGACTCHQSHGGMFRIWK